MRYLSIGEVLALYDRIMSISGSQGRILNLAALEGALAQPRITFGGADLYPTIVEKAAVLGFLLVSNHPFSDGNKRIGHAAMEVFLLLNGFEVESPIDEQERTILQVASGQASLQDFTRWLQAHIVPKKSA